VDNDANAVLLGECMAGAAQGARQAVVLTLGTGVGGAIVINGKLFRGAQGGAGEIGHCTVQAEGPRCRCGNRGCLERYVGAGYLVQRYLHLKGEKAEGGRQKEESGKGTTPADIAHRAKKGDPAAIKVFEEAGKRIGVACANLVNLLQPEVIVIGGGVAGAGRVLFDAIRKTVKERAFEPSWQGTRIVPGKLKGKAGILGAAALIEP
jgi:glucokinase